MKADDTERVTTPELSEFHQVFKPHAVRPGTRWAAVNRWTEGKPTSEGISKPVEQCSAEGAYPNGPLEVHLLMIRLTARSHAPT